MSGEKTNTDYSANTGAKITEEHLERARMLIGYEEAQSQRQQVTTAREDNIRVFAFCYGDDNPLHADPDYGKKTRWGSVIAPGTMIIGMGEPLLGDPRPEALAKAKKGLFKGIHNMHSGTEWDWYRPIRPGDTIYGFKGEERVEVKESNYGGTSVLRVARDVRMNQHGEVVAVQRALMVLSERGTAAKRGKYMDTQPASYTDEDLAAIDAIYAAEKVRGAELRHFEDVEVGESLGVQAKGPLTVTDIILFHTGGFAIFPFGPVTARAKYKRQQVMPAAFVKDAKGIPDIVMRMHWDDDWARALGSPMAYDYGFQRECWLFQYLTDWCGDDAIVLRMRDEMRKFNYLGDVQTITGEVVAKRVEDGQAVVDVAVKFTSQRSDVTVNAFATIALPSREHGQAQYPEPPAEIAAKAKAMMARHNELSAG